MIFDAIVHAPRMRLGARLNIAQADQSVAQPPRMLTIGAEIRLRIGVCAPDLAYGRITRCTADWGRVVLVVGEANWTLCRSEGEGVAAPGLISETWYVVPAVGDRAASPTDHSPEYSAHEAARKG